MCRHWYVTRIPEIADGVGGKTGGGRRAGSDDVGLLLLLAMVLKLKPKP
jgi:hypothetical protein